MPRDDYGYEVMRLCADVETVAVRLDEVAGLCDSVELAKQTMQEVADLLWDSIDPLYKFYDTHGAERTELLRMKAWVVGLRNEMEKLRIEQGSYEARMGDLERRWKGATERVVELERRLSLPDPPPPRERFREAARRAERARAAEKGTG